MKKFRVIKRQNVLKNREVDFQVQERITIQSTASVINNEKGSVDEYWVTVGNYVDETTSVSICMDLERNNGKYYIEDVVYPKES